MPDSLWPLLSMLVNQAPYFVAELVALILAIVNWSKCPRPALLTVVAVGISFGASIAHAVLWSQIITSGIDDADLTLKLSAIGWGRSIFGVIAYGLMLWAIFGWRTVSAPGRRRPLVDEDAGNAVDPSTDIRTARRSDRE
jgi:hypothetical protein